MSLAVCMINNTCGDNADDTHDDANNTSVEMMLSQGGWLVCMCV